MTQWGGERYPGGSSLGMLIRYTRQSKKMSLEDVAKRLDVSISYMSQVERGICTIPSNERLKQIAEVLDININDLLVISGTIPDETFDTIIKRPKYIYVVLEILSKMDEKEINLLIDYLRVKYDK